MSRHWSVGTVEAPEYAHHFHSDGEDNVIAVFRTFDRNGDGTLEAAELAEVLKALDPNRWTRQAVDQLLDKADSNRDGRVDVEEFVRFVFYDADGNSVVDGVFRSVPAELRAELMEASERRMKVIVDINPRGLKQMLGWKRPPPAAVVVMSAVTWLIFERGDPDPSEAWKLAKELCLERPQEFLDGLLNPPWTISADSVARADAALADPGFSPEALQGEGSVPGGRELLDWAQAVLDVHHAFQRFGGVPKHEKEQKPPELVVTVPWAKTVSTINKRDLTELKTLKSPPRLVWLVLAAVGWLLTERGHSDAFYSWRYSRSLMLNTSKFMDKLLHPPAVVGTEALNKVDEIILECGPDWNRSSADKVSPCLAALVEWVTIMVQVQRYGQEFRLVEAEG